MSSFITIEDEVHKIYEDVGTFENSVEKETCKECGTELKETAVWRDNFKGHIRATLVFHCMKCLATQGKPSLKKALVKDF